MLRVKLTHAGAAAKVVDVPAGAGAVDATARLASAAFGIPLARITLYGGYPPAPLASISGGCVVDVRAAAPPPTLERHIVPADNACLFTAVGFLMEGRMDLASSLRARVVSSLRADAAEWSDVVLGRPRTEYIAHISLPSSWGGGVELRVLAKALRVELAAVEVRTGTVYVFGEGDGFSQRAFMLYDGLHYDAVVLRSGGSVQRLFPANDAAVLAGVEALAADARAKHQFTDLAGATLRCGACGAGLVGEADAVAHAEATGHSNFTEVVRR